MSVHLFTCSAEDVTHAHGNIALPLSFTVQHSASMLMFSNGISLCVWQWNGRVPLWLGILFLDLLYSNKGKTTFQNVFKKIRQNWERAAVCSPCQTVGRSADLHYFLKLPSEFLKKLLMICFHSLCHALSLSSSNPDGFQHLTIALPTWYSSKDQEVRGVVRGSASWAAC